MQTLILDAADLQRLVVRVGIDQLMDELIARIQHAFIAFDATATEIPQRSGFHYGSPTGLIEWMPLHQRGDKVLMKLVGYHPASPARHGLPTIVSTISTYDTTNGHLTSIADATFLTAMRTGAASAVATQLLARPDSKVLGLVGCGAQAVTQLHAISRRLDLTEALVYDIDPDVADNLVARVGAFQAASVSIKVTSLREIAERSDVICTATSVDAGAGPVIDLAQTQPWLHVNAVGSDFPGKTELPQDFLQRSFVCPDFALQARVEGECQQLSSSDIAEPITNVAQAPNNFARARQRTSVFDSTGWALEDWVAMELAVEKANELGLGKHVAIESLTGDPRNPYDFLCGTTASDARPKQPAMSNR